MTFSKGRVIARFGVEKDDLAITQAIFMMVLYNGPTFPTQLITIMVFGYHITSVWRHGKDDCDSGPSSASRGLPANVWM